VTLTLAHLSAGGGHCPFTSGSCAAARQPRLVARSGLENGITNKPDVLIAGAGPTGLTLAIDLARRGVNCRIIDKSPSYFPGSRAKGLMPRTLEVFDDLGIVDAVAAAGGPFPPFRGYHGATVLWDRTIHQMAGFQELTPSPDLPYTQFLMIPQWRTEEILRDRLATLGGRVELGTELTGFWQDADGVTALLGSGESVRCR
jgi:2-polyprenyl-6-methoxyphenol hydroxylase-like FAD-dependent oxidoreductase